MASILTPGTRSIIDEVLRSIGRHSTTTPGDSNAPTFPMANRNTSIASSAQHHDSTVKRLLVTLHFFFPHELLPALDLMDRGLVRCFVLKDPNTTSSNANDSRADGGGKTGTLAGIAGDPSVINEGSKVSPSTMTEKPAHPTAPPPPPRPKEVSNIITPTPTPTKPTPDRRNVSIEVWYVQSASAITDNRNNPVKSSSRPNIVGGSSHTHHGSGQGQGRYRNALRATNTFYEVRLDSWNCSCAAFAFGVLKGLGIGMERDGDAMRKKEGHDGKKSRKGDESGMRDGRRGVEGEGERKPKGGDEMMGGGERGGEGVARDDEEWAFGGTVTKLEYCVPVTVCKHILAALLAKAAPGLCGENGSGVKRETSGEEMAGWAAGWGDSG